MGNLEGGAEALGFGITPPVNKGTLGELAGIVASSPLIRQSTAEPAWKLWLGDKAAKLFPGKQVDTPVDSSVGHSTQLPTSTSYLSFGSHRPSVMIQK
jgi:hypothetical protein